MSTAPPELPPVVPASRLSAPRTAFPNSSGTAVNGPLGQEIVFTAVVLDGSSRAAGGPRVTVLRTPPQYWRVCRNLPDLRRSRRLPIVERARQSPTGIESFPFLSTDHLGNAACRSQSADWRSTLTNPSQNPEQEHRSHCPARQASDPLKGCQIEPNGPLNAGGLAARSSAALTWRYRGHIGAAIDGQPDDLHVNSADRFSTECGERSRAPTGTALRNRPATDLRTSEAPDPKRAADSATPHRSG